MTTRKIDNVSAGIVFAYDAKTGDVLWTHEKFVEVTDGQKSCSTRITDDECEAVRAETASVFPDRKVAVLTAPEEFELRQNVLISVDTEKKRLCESREEPPQLADRFARHGK